MCHCWECQKRTGSIFGVQARYARDMVKIKGSSTAFTRKGDSGGEITFHFCPQCGSTVYWEIAALPDFLAIAVGNFTDASFSPPTVSVYESRRHSWAKMPELNLEMRG